MRARKIFAAVARASLLASLLASAGCSSLGGVIAGATPSHGARIVRDIAYAPGDRHSLDLYEPPHGAQTLPIVVFIYGGTWQAGNKQLYAFVGKALAAKGYVVAIPDYRLYPQVRYPAFLQDNALAVRWVRDHAGEYGGDPKRIFLMGHSAGAYDAIMLAVDRRWLGAVGMDPRTDIRASVGLAGPYDFLPLTDKKLKIIFGPEAGWPDTQPINHVEPGEPPLLLTAGASDIVIDPDNNARMAARVHARGAEAVVKIYPSVTHPLILGAFAGPLRFIAPVLRDVVAFMQAHDAPAGRADAR